MKRMLLALIVVAALGLAPAIKAEIVGPSEFTAGTDSSMGLAFSTETIMVRGTTGEDSLEIARVELSVNFWDTPAGDSITGMDFYFNLSATSFVWHFDSLVTVNWPGNDTLIEVSSEHYYLDMDGAAIPATIGETVLAYLYFTVNCVEEGATDTISWNTLSTELSLDGNDYKPGGCDSCWVNGAVIVDDYWMSTYFEDEELYNGYNQEFTVDVYALNNFRLFAISDTLEYDTTKLEFLGLDAATWDVWDDYTGSDTIDPAAYPINVALMKDMWSHVEVMSDTLDNKLFGLRFRVKDNLVWDSSTTLITFGDSNMVLVADQYLFCNDLSQNSGGPAVYDFSDTGYVTLEKYEADLIATPVADGMYVGSANKSVTYSLAMKNSFDAGMPNSSSAYEGAISFNIDCTDNFAYESISNESDLITFDGTLGSLGVPGHKMLLYQIWDAGKSGYLPYQASYDTATHRELAQLEFEYSGADPDDYTTRYLNVFDFVDVTTINLESCTTKVSSTQLEAGVPLIVATQSNDRLSFADDSLEIPMGQFYTTGGSGAAFSRIVTSRNNFEVDTFNITGTLQTHFRVDSILTSGSVDYNLDSTGSTFSLYSGTNRSATGDDWDTLATVYYSKIYTPPCGTTWYDTLVFSDYFMKDTDSLSRFLDMPPTVVLSIYGGNCGGNPSCPVLYSWNGIKFVEQNPLLTASEASNYTNSVTDYYVVPGVQPSENGLVSFELRELEHEITTLEDVSLITVDHSPNSYVSCSMEGQIATFLATTVPATAVDHRGDDVLAKVSSTDRIFYQSEEPGYIIVTFPQNSGKGTGFSLATAEKEPCKPIPKEAEGIDAVMNQITVEILGDDGQWMTLTDEVPSRVYHTHEIVSADLSALMATKGITMKVSWTKRYTTDVINMLNPADEPISIERHTTSRAQFSGLKASREWTGAADYPIILNKDEMLSFSFNVGPIPKGFKRDYIIVAYGRYEPNYSVYTDLIPNSYKLYDNYPNPFNPSTTIGFDLPNASEVKLEVFNLLGQHVVTLVDDFHDAGHHEVEWHSVSESGKVVASGVYFYKLTTSDFTQSKKMVLIK